MFEWNFEILLSISTDNNAMTDFELTFQNDELS